MEAAKDCALFDKFKHFLKIDCCLTAESKFEKEKKIGTKKIGKLRKFNHFASESFQFECGKKIHLMRNFGRLLRLLGIPASYCMQNPKKNYARLLTSMLNIQICL